jgi:type I restriction enzyme S subunit
MNEWKEFEIGELVTFQRGHDLPKSEMKNGTYPVAGSNSIIGYHNKFTTKAPGITIGRSGNLGKPLLHKMDFWAHNTTLYVKEFKKVDPIFFYYFLHTLDFSHLNSGSAVPTLNRNYLHPLKVRIPERISIQKCIAEILSSLDDKIELNNQINENLEALAQAIFKHWFIDFEFPDENGNPYKSSGGKMVESELGQIPEGWNVGELQEILEVKGGGTPSTKNEEFWDGDVNWTSPKDLSKLKFPVLLETEKKITASGLKKISSGLLPKGTLLMSSRAPIGYLAITEIDTAINQGYIAINCKGSFDNLFMLFWLKQNIASVTAMANGSTFLEVNKANFKKIKIVIPKPNVHNIFVDHIKHMFELLTQNEKESRNLESLRDTILPRLISGTLELL